MKTFEFNNGTIKQMKCLGTALTYAHDNNIKVVRYY